MIVVTTASPVMLIAVRPMSRMRSMPMIMATPSAGRPTLLKTIASMIVPTPGTPAVPIDAVTAVTTVVSSIDGVRSMPKAWAMNTTAAPCMMAVPSMLIVAPRGMVNDVTLLSTPTFFSSVSMLRGIVAFDELVEKANTMTGQNLRRKWKGFRRVNRKSSSMYTTSSCRARPR